MSDEFHQVARGWSCRKLRFGRRESTGLSSSLQPYQPHVSSATQANTQHNLVHLSTLRRLKLCSVTLALQDAVLSRRGAVATMNPPEEVGSAGRGGGTLQLSWAAWRPVGKPGLALGPQVSVRVCCNRLCQGSIRLHIPKALLWLKNLCCVMALFHFPLPPPTSYICYLPFIVFRLDLFSSPPLPSPLSTHTAV